ncbi:hypothetical protein M8C21_015282 [Ambrosia artemisiifolia]|uniref:Sodium/calcium exchanger membrane region domain-containing protein n=1 Tax=Ambrosia artemisiifolia TaxID=4212 RepID=A0AAD5G5N0_AMBAR|nr:hypothetical protein M8C21_015282 [Ambrosia artemisiifolia]
MSKHAYVVGIIEEASETWGLSVSFMGIILLPIVGNAAEHAGAVIPFQEQIGKTYTYKNGISLGVALGSATQILMFVVPLCVILAWIMGIQMSLDFGLLETACLAFSIFLTAFTLQDSVSYFPCSTCEHCGKHQLGALKFKSHRTQSLIQIPQSRINQLNS